MIVALIALLFLDDILHTKALRREKIELTVALPLAATVALDLPDVVALIVLAHRLERVGTLAFVVRDLDIDRLFVAREANLIIRTLLALAARERVRLLGQGVTVFAGD